ncbi:PREDICTED: tissue factor-like [Cyprinodon variegatus]|uniref:tissue factor-like n=1 Tax=Cyprinodon variegatus TaxID=28743 RepID=UPI0007425379|nr:PREDICTED: tissue factor-like [Cyprinodon variegatus]
MLPRLHPSAAPTLSAPPQRQLALKHSSFSSEQVVWKGIQRVSMASIRALLCVGAFMAAAWSKTTGGGSIPTAQNVRWVSNDFKTVLLWDMEESEYTCTVLFTEGTNNWIEARDCMEISHSECEMTEYLLPLDRYYKADIRTEGPDVSYNYGSEDFPHTYSKTTFNPYRESGYLWPPCSCCLLFVSSC